jgi:Zn-dependent M28 family amino/carboxypeptidase
MTDEPRVWLVAHTDSKSQTIPMLVRVGSIAAAGLFFAIQLATLVIVWIESRGFADFPTELHALAASAGYLTAIAIIPVILCFISNKSPGALDNATGVAAVLIAAAMIPRDRNVGIVLTSGEELGLAGARAFVASRTVKGIAINCDTVDNSGKFIAMRHRRGESGVIRMASVASTLGERVRVRPLIRGILTDGIAFGESGWDSWTLSRGNIGTLAFVHTSRDRPERIVGTGIAIAARILAATAEELS